MRTKVVVLAVLMRLFSFSISAQHLSFMGIPLNCTIDQFQTQLAGKGIYPEVEMNRSLPFGERMFSGTFAGYPCQIALFYNNNRIVYQARVGYGNSSESFVDMFYSDIQSSLAAKYSGCKSVSDTYTGYPSFAIVVTNNEGYNIGLIGISKTRIDALGTTVFTSFIDYYDWINGYSEIMKHWNDL